MELKGLNLIITIMYSISQMIMNVFLQLKYNLEIIKLNGNWYWK